MRKNFKSNLVVALVLESKGLYYLGAWDNWADPSCSKGGQRYPPYKSLSRDSAIVFPNTYPLNRDLYRCLVSRPHYFARPNFGSRGPLVRLGYVTVINWLRGAGKRRKGARAKARALSNFWTTGARLSETEAEAEDQEITTCLFSRVMIGLILLKLHW